MKHQRAALSLTAKEKVADDSRTEETEENEDDNEYVVERLDLDEDDTMDTQENKVQVAEMGTVEIEEEKDSSDICLQLQLSDEEEHKPVIKKIELSEVCDLSCIIFVRTIFLRGENAFVSESVITLNTFNTFTSYINRTNVMTHWLKRWPTFMVNILEWKARMRT